MKKPQLIINSAFVLIVILLAVICSLFYSNNKTLKSQLKERDDYLTTIVSNDSLGIVRRDSLVNRLARAIFKVGDQEYTGEQFVQYVNEIINQYNTISDSLHFYKAYYKMTQKLYEVEFTGEKSVVAPALESNEWKFSISYPATDTLSSSQVGSFVSHSVLLNDMAQKYGINIFENENGIGYNSPTIDSALLLLPYFRGSLTFVPDKNVWTITLPRTYKRLLDNVTTQYGIEIKERDGYYTIASPKLDSALMLLPYFRNNIRYDAESRSWVIAHYGESQR